MQTESLHREGGTHWAVRRPTIPRWLRVAPGLHYIKGAEERARLQAVALEEEEEEGVMSVEAAVEAVEGGWKPGPSC